MSKLGDALKTEIKLCKHLGTSKAGAKKGIVWVLDAMLDRIYRGEKE